MDQKIKIAFLLPMTSNKWEKVEDSYFNQIFIRSLIGTTNLKYIYKIYLVIDRDDKLFFNDDFKKFEILNNLFKNIKNNK